MQVGRISWHLRVYIGLLNGLRAGWPWILLLFHFVSGAFLCCGLPALYIYSCVGGLFGVHVCLPMCPCRDLSCRMWGYVIKKKKNKYGRYKEYAAYYCDKNKIMNMVRRPR